MTLPDPAALWSRRPPLPEEDIFGNSKKVRLFLARLDAHREELGRPLNILDFGCGSGLAFAQFLTCGPDRYIGVDIHHDSLDYARARFGNALTTFHEEVPIEPCFDVVLYGDVLEHLDDPLGYLRRHCGQLAQDGIFLGSIPNGYGPCEMEKFIDRKLHLYQGLRYLWRAARVVAGLSKPPSEPVPYNLESGHVQFFTRRSLRAMVEAAGLEIRWFAHGGFVGADLLGSTILSPAPLVSLNVKIADHLPYWMVSTWYFELGRRQG